MSRSKRNDNSNEHTLIVDGKFLTEKLTGVQRVAYELVRELSKMQGLKIIIAAEKGALVPNDFPKSVQVVETGIFKGHLWEQISLPRFCRRNKLPLLCTGNLAPAFLKNDYVILHDVTYLEKGELLIPEWESWARKVAILVRCYIYRVKRIITVSKFSSSRIEYFYPKLKDSPALIYNGWEHIARIEQEKVDGLEGEFFLSVGSANPNKNFKYVFEIAKHNPDKQFIITGKPRAAFDEYIKKNGVQNCRFLGYVSDGELMWLYHYCSGFILPSIFEGFGVPPLEALAAGCKRLYLSSIDVFKEIYGGVANFFDPRDYENTVDLDSGKCADEKTVSELLQKYSWKNSAQAVYNVIFGEE